MSEAETPKLPYHPETRRETPGPITFTGIARSLHQQAAWVPTGRYCPSCGTMVSIRPCATEYGDKTYLGVYLGDIARDVGVGYHPETQTLITQFGSHNPAIFVPDLNTVIFGDSSWWGEIKDESQLREITDDDIQNVWYVKALKQLAEQDAKDAPKS